MSTYTLENAWQQARERLAGLEAVYDPGTFRVLDGVGVGPGWRCLEIGGGGGTVAEWLCAKVGPHGHVLATDIDPRFLEPLTDDHPNLDARRHDIVSDDLPPAAFNLIHARMVLEHLPERDRALRRMAAALVPGGWLVVEAIDFGSEAPDPALDAATTARFVRSHVARTRFLADHGFDLAFARGVSRRLRTLGMVDVATEGRSYTWWGNTAGANVWRLSFEQRRDSFIGGSYLDESEFAEIVAMLLDPSFAATSPTIVAAWGRRPAPGLT
ncbi:MAG: class I SAM-dependent methyltransferase [Thermomicrobiales bacterium]